MIASILMAVIAEGGWFHPSTLGWIVIAIAWSIIGTLWLAGSVLTGRWASRFVLPGPPIKATEEP